MSHIFLLDTGALKTTGGKAEVPSLHKEGWLRPLRKCRGASLAGADGHERSECEPDRAKQGRMVGSSHRLSEVERTTPAAPSKEWDHLLDGAATPPLPHHRKEGWLRHQRKFGEATEGDAAGVVFLLDSSENHPGLAISGCFAIFSESLGHPSLQ